MSAIASLKKFSPGDNGFVKDLLGSMHPRDIFATALALNLKVTESMAVQDVALVIEANTSAEEQSELLSFESSGNFLAQVCDLRLQTARPTTIIVGTIVALVAVSFFMVILIGVLGYRAARSRRDFRDVKRGLVDAEMKMSKATDSEAEDKVMARPDLLDLVAASPQFVHTAARTQAALWVTAGLGAVSTAVSTSLSAAFAEKMRINGNSNSRCGVLRQSLARAPSNIISSMGALCMNSLWPGDLNRGFDTWSKGISGASVALHAQHINAESEWWYFAMNTKAFDGTSVDMVFLVTRNTIVPRGFLQETDERTLAGTAIHAITGGVTIAGKQHAFTPLTLSGANPVVKVTDNPVSWMVGKSGFRSTALASSDSIFPFELTLADPTNGIQVSCVLDNSRYPQDENMLLQGDRGFVPPCTPRIGIGMQYYSFPNVETTCTVTRRGAQTLNCYGITWVDHQYGSAIRPDTRIPKAFPRWVDAIATDRDAKEPFAISTLGGWNWFALHMQEEDGSWSHWTGDIRLMNTTARTGSPLFSCDSGKGFFENTSTFVNFNGLTLHVESAEINGHLPMSAGVPFPTQVGVQLNVGSAVRTATIKVSADSGDYLHGTPCVFYEIPVVGTWTPLGGSTPRPVFGFFEQQGTGAYTSQMESVFKGAGLSREDVQRYWFSDALPREVSVKTRPPSVSPSRPRPHPHPTSRP